MLDSIDSLFQVDTLEIHLRETADLVDHFFLVEATHTHRGDKKPILWERLKYEQSNKKHSLEWQVHREIQLLERRPGDPCCGRPLGGRCGAQGKGQDRG